MTGRDGVLHKDTQATQTRVTESSRLVDTRHIDLLGGRGDRSLIRRTGVDWSGEELELIEEESEFIGWTGVDQGGPESIGTESD